MKRRVIFRADGNAEIGYGHFIRTIGIAGLIKKDFECVFATFSPTDYQLEEIYKNCDDLIELSDAGALFEEFLKYVRANDIVVIDSYSFSSAHQLEIRSKGCKVIYIDDHNDKHYVCDALINNIPGFPEDSFHKENYTKLFLGTDYALLRKEFFNPELRNITKKENTVFLSFGGSDIHNISQKIIEYLNRINPQFEINLLIGDAYQFFENLSEFKGLKIYKNINASEVAKLIAESGVIIIPASSLLNEASCIGSKILIGYFAENQLQPYNYFLKNELAIGVGDYRQVSFELFKSRMEEVISSGSMIEKQRYRYRYQQEQNLKNIFKHV